MTRKLVVVGHGMVAQRFLEKLVANPANPYGAIDVISAEAVPAYNRILLSSVLAGEAGMDAIRLQDDDWFARNGIHLRQNDAGEVLDTRHRNIVTRSGEVIQYDELVIATGARPASLKLPGEDLEGVMTFRDIRDTEKLLAISKQHRRAVVIGGGFLGLEAAEGLRQRGMAVTVIHRSHHLLNRQLDPTAGELLQSALRGRGMQLEIGQSPKALIGNKRVRAVQLEDDTLLSTDLVVLAAGITPNIEMAREAGLACGRGIQVNERLQTSDPTIYAVGECCEIDRQTFGLVEPGYQQATTLAKALCGEQASFSAGQVATRLKISGIPIFSCGDTQPGPDTESVVWQDHDTDRYCHLLMRRNRLMGAVLFGETRDGPWYFDQLQEQNDLSAHRQNLAFGAAYCGATG